MLMNFLVPTVRYAEILILLLFAHENMKNLTSKVGYFRKIKEKFITALAAQKAEKATKI